MSAATSPHHRPPRVPEGQWTVCSAANLLRMAVKAAKYWRAAGRVHRA